MIVVIFDTETTGLIMPGAPIEQQPRIIELAALVVRDGEIVDRFEWLFNPGTPLDPVITKITGLTDADLAGKPSFLDCHQAVHFVMMGGDLLVAHNAPFDMGMLTNEFSRCGLTGWMPRGTVECTVQNYFHLFGHRPKLTDLYEKILGKSLQQTHRAMGDCMALYEILKQDGFFAQPLQLTTKCFTGEAPCPPSTSLPPSPPSEKPSTKKAKTSIAKKPLKKPSALKSKGKKPSPKSSAKVLASRKRRK